MKEEIILYRNGFYSWCKWQALRVLRKYLWEWEKEQRGREVEVRVREATSLSEYPKILIVCICVLYAQGWLL